jgi:hypothetical protein
LNENLADENQTKPNEILRRLLNWHSTVRFGENKKISIIIFILSFRFASTFIQESHSRFEVAEKLRMQSIFFEAMAAITEHKNNYSIHTI